MNGNGTGGNASRKTFSPFDKPSIYPKTWSNGQSLPELNPRFTPTRDKYSVDVDGNIAYFHNGHGHWYDKSDYKYMFDGSNYDAYGNPTRADPYFGMAYGSHTGIPAPYQGYKIRKNTTT